MTNFLSFFFPKAKVIEELIDPREDIEEVKEEPKEEFTRYEDE
jgi:hypothetical protein